MSGADEVKLSIDDDARCLPGKEICLEFPRQLVLQKQTYVRSALTSEECQEATCACGWHPISHALRSWDYRTAMLMHNS
jgi:hypothetical protein